MAEFHTLSSYFCTSLSLQPSPAQKLTVLLNFGRNVEQTKKERRGALHGMVNQHLITTQ